MTQVCRGPEIQPTAANSRTRRAMSDDMRELDGRGDKW